MSGHCNFSQANNSKNDHPLAILNHNNANSLLTTATTKKLSSTNTSKKESNENLLSHLNETSSNTSITNQDLLQPYFRKTAFSYPWHSNHNNNNHNINNNKWSHKVASNHRVSDLQTMSQKLPRKAAKLKGMLRTFRYLTLNQSNEIIVNKKFWLQMILIYIITYATILILSTLTSFFLFYLFKRKYQQQTLRTLTVSDMLAIGEVPSNYGPAYSTNTIATKLISKSITPIMDSSIKNNITSINADSSNERKAMHRIVFTCTDKAILSVVFYTLIGIALVILSVMAAHYWFIYVIVNRLNKEYNIISNLFNVNRYKLGLELEKCLNLVDKMMPRHVARSLMQGQTISPEYYDSVTILFSDIVGFTIISGTCSPQEVLNMLNTLFTSFDARLDYYDIYKVETIGDAYMCVSGVPTRNGTRHVEEISLFALDIMSLCKSIEIPHKRSQYIEMRIGIHSGSIVAGVIGAKMPRYCLFGDTVNVASRMESTSETCKIQFSQVTHDLLVERDSSFIFEPRGEIKIKGKKEMNSYWLLGKRDWANDRSHQVCYFIPKWKRKKKCKEPQQHSS